jgi:glucose-1-phosphate adenylyltransferase
MEHDDILAILLAGGAGERLSPLTKDRAKPAVYFGGPYRIIDFTLSNCINSGFRRIYIATQYKSLSLSRHIRMGWNVVSEELGEFVEILPPQKRVGEHWYLGTADAVYQNLYSITRESASHVFVLSGDHVYKMDYAKMLRFHIDRQADATLATIEVPVHDARRFGIVSIDGEDRVMDFQEKPAHPAHIPGSPDAALASMGIYVFKADVLVRALEQDAADPHSEHDFGKNIIPSLIHRAPVYSYRFHDENKKHPRCVLRGEHGPVPRQPRIQSLRPRMAAPHVSAPGSAREVRVRRGAPVWTRTRFDHLERLHHLRKPRERQHPLP